MTPPRQYAALRALAYGLSVVLDGLKDNVVQFRTLTDSKGFATPWGEVTFRKVEPTIELPSVELLGWARDRMPHEVVEAETLTVPEQTVTVEAHVRPTLLKTLKGDGKKPGRFRIVDGQVVDRETGEIIDWAAVVQPDPEPVFTLSKDAKEEAPVLVQSRLAQITSAVAGELE